METGWPYMGIFTWNVAELELDTWVTYSIPVADFVANPFLAPGWLDWIPGVGEGDPLPLDTSNVGNLLTVEFHGGVHFQLDNISLTCTSNESCIQGPLAVAARSAFWSGGTLLAFTMICLRVSGRSGIAVAEQLLKKLLRKIASRGMVTQITYSGTNTVSGFAYGGDPDGTAAQFLGSGFDGGTLEFDLLQVSPGAGAWILKVESEDADINSGDVLLTASNEGVEPQTGVWQHYTFPLSEGAACKPGFECRADHHVIPVLGCTGWWHCSD